MVLVRARTAELELGHLSAAAMADLITADPIEVDTNEEIVMAEDADVDIEDLDDDDLDDSSQDEDGAEDGQQGVICELIDIREPLVEEEKAKKEKEESKSNYGQHNVVVADAKAHDFHVTGSLDRTYADFCSFPAS